MKIVNVTENQGLRHGNIPEAVCMPRIDSPPISSPNPISEKRKQEMPLSVLLVLQPLL